MERCVTCQYYDRRKPSEAKGAQAGQCRRSAPALSPINAKSYMIEGVWPTVRDDDWCGEWKPLARRSDAPRADPLLSPSLPLRGEPALPRIGAAAGAVAPAKPLGPLAAPLASAAAIPPASRLGLECAEPMLTGGAAGVSSFAVAARRG